MIYEKAFVSKRNCILMFVPQFRVDGRPKKPLFLIICISVDTILHQSTACVNLTAGLTRGQSMSRSWWFFRSPTKKLFICPFLSLTWFPFFLSLRCDCPLKPEWGTVRAPVSKRPCHLACWLWAGPYPASISLHFQSQALWGRIREREGGGS